MEGERVDRSEYGFAIIASSLRDEFVPPHSSLEEVAPRASFPPSPLPLLLPTPEIATFRGTNAETIRLCNLWL